MLATDANFTVEKSPQARHFQLSMEVSPRKDALDEGTQKFLIAETKTLWKTRAPPKV